MTTLRVLRGLGDLRGSTFAAVFVVLRRDDGLVEHAHAVKAEHDEREHDKRCET